VQERLCQEKRQVREKEEEKEEEEEQQTSVDPRAWLRR
jgi:hypothetical protein